MARQLPGCLYARNGFSMIFICSHCFSSANRLAGHSFIWESADARNWQPLPFLLLLGLQWGFSVPSFEPSQLSKAPKNIIDPSMQ